MAYIPLARKYRPQSFSDLIGQSAVAQALSNSIELKREARAVIFSGVRGIGKTTIARLYAKALNCVQGPTPSPCGICTSCEAIAQGIHEDVLEIDGASNTSVDDVRQLRETVSYAPQRSPYKVYLIDEVHMLSNSAFNALLKTLEEPPSHVVFLFATTELQKIPQTIVGRCQTFYLKTFGLHDIIERLRHILDQEAIQYEEKVLFEIARRGNGSMRDALTLLDTAIAVSGHHLKMSTLKELLSTTDQMTLIAFLGSLIDKDAHALVQSIDGFIQDGLDLSELCQDISMLCRHAFMLRDVKDFDGHPSLLALSVTEAKQLKELAIGAPLLDLNRLFRSFMQCRTELDGSELDRYVFENYCLEWCLDPGFIEIDGLINQGSTGSRAASSPKIPKASDVRTQSSQSGPSSNPVTAPKIQEPTAKKNLVEAFLQSHQPKPEQHDSVSAAVAKATEVISQAVHEASQVEDSETPATLNHQPLTATPNEPVTTTDIETHTPNEQPASKVAQVKGESTTFPQSWRDLVDQWQRLKPIQARIFEESYSLHFDAELIRIGVKPETMAGKKLLTAEIQSKTLQMLQEMFGFEGRFEVVDKHSYDAQPNQSAHQIEVESILDTKQREKADYRSMTEENLRNAPLTKLVQETFGATIESVEVFPQERR